LILTIRKQLTSSSQTKSRSSVEKTKHLITYSIQNKSVAARKIRKGGSKKGYNDTFIITIPPKIASKHVGTKFFVISYGEDIILRSGATL